jgi:hypothetical protein
MASIRPSTCSGTPLIIRSGGDPSRSGQFCRITSKLAPIPPDVTITAGACSSNGPTSVRELRVPRAAELGSSTAPRTPSTAPPVTVSPSTRCRNRNPTRPSDAASRTRRTNGASTPGPVPQVTWNLGTELPCPSAR